MAFHCAHLDAFYMPVITGNEAWSKARASLTAAIVNGQPRGY